MNTIRLQRRLLAPALFIPFIALAQTPSSLDPIVVTASRVAQLESETLGDVSVVPNEKLRKAGQQSLAEILAQEPGIAKHHRPVPKRQRCEPYAGSNRRRTH